MTSFPAGIDCSTSCSGTFNSGATVTLMPRRQWVLSSLPGRERAVPRQLPQSWSHEVPTVTAPQLSIYKRPTFTLAVANAGTGSGTITSSPAGINCGSTCSGSYTSGATVALTAAPATNSTFVSWTGTGCSASTATINVSISVSRSCTATYIVSGTIL